MLSSVSTAAAPLDGLVAADLAVSPQLSMPVVQWVSYIRTFTHCKHATKQAAHLYTSYV